MHGLGRLIRIFAVALALVPMAASAATIQLRAWLNGAQVPAPVSGTGLGTVTFDTVSKQVTWSVSYQGLSGSCTVAHFHGPASAGVDASPTVGMATCPANPLTGSATLSPTQEAQLLSGQLYINIHTSLYPGGEIRGQVVRLWGDFSGDGRADLLWRNSSTGENYFYPMNGTAIGAGEGYVRTVADQSWRIMGYGDFNGDGRADVLWRNAVTGENYVYFMDGTSIASEGYLRTVADLNWKVAAIGDFNGDGKDDILWRNQSTGENYVYLMNGTTIAGEGYIRTVADQSWNVVWAGDFNGDGKADILWRNQSSGQNYIYFMDGLTILAGEGYIRTVADLNWDVNAIGDYDGDGRTDIFWRNRSTGENYVYPMAGLAIKPTEGYVRTVADPSWQVAGFGDFNGDGRADLFWRNGSTGENYIYLMDGTTIAGEGYVRTVADQAWKIAWPGGDGGGGQTPQLQLAFNFPQGTFNGSNAGVLTYPTSLAYYFANFQSGTDPSPPPSVFFTGPSGSGLSNTESAARFLSTGSAGYTSPSQFGVIPPGGAWIVNYKGTDIPFNLPDPDASNRAINIVPTVMLSGDNVTRIDWVYKNTDGATVPAPSSVASYMEFSFDGLVSGQVVRLYGQQNVPIATTSHVLTSAVSWSAVTMIQMVLLDNLGNRYTSYWNRTPPPAPTIGNLNPTMGPVGSTVTITGTNFGCTGCVGGVNALRFTGSGGSGSSGVAAQFTIDSPTQITATVPATALNGTIWLQSIGGPATSSQVFTVQ